VGIHQNFGINLRIQCQKFQSIAEACRAIDINRQQFNKYLSGAMLPNARTLQRICAVFGTEEWELFKPEENRSELSNDEKGAQQNSTLTAFTKAMAARGSFSDMFKVDPNTALQPGLYKCFFPLPGIRGCLIPSTVSISTSCGFHTFTRHTRLSSPSSPQHKIAQGKHHGIVLSNGTFDYMIGCNTVSPNDISLVCLPRDLTGGTGLRIGIAIVQGLSPLFACRVAMQQIGNSRAELKKTLKENTAINLCETSQDRMIAEIVHTPQKDGSAQLALLDFHELLLGTNISAILKDQKSVLVA
jgi:transcriptional regulator with XRE-family HTH domain